MVFSIRSLALISFALIFTACSGGPEVDSNSGASNRASTASQQVPNWYRPDPTNNKIGPDGKPIYSEKDIQKAEESYLKNLKALKSNTIVPVSTILASVFDHSNSASMSIYDLNQDEAGVSPAAVMNAEIEEAFLPTDIESACCGQENPRLSVCFKEQMEELNAAIKAVEKNKSLNAKVLNSVEFRVLDNTAKTIKDEKQTVVLREYLKHGKYRQMSSDLSVTVYDISVNTLSKNGGFLGLGKGSKRETAFGEFFQVSDENHLRLTYILNDDERLSKGCHPVRKDNIVDLFKKGLKQ